MDNLTTIMQTMAAVPEERRVEVRDVMIWLLINGDAATLTGIGRAIGLSKQGVQYAYNRASERMNWLADNGYFQTSLQDVADAKKR